MGGSWISTSRTMLDWLFSRLLPAASSPIRQGYVNSISHFHPQGRLQIMNFAIEEFSRGGVLSIASCSTCCCYCRSIVNLTKCCSMSGT